MKSSGMNNRDEAKLLGYCIRSLQSKHKQHVCIHKESDLLQGISSHDYEADKTQDLQSKSATWKQMLMLQLQPEFEGLKTSRTDDIVPVV